MRSFVGGTEKTGTPGLTLTHPSPLLSPLLSALFFGPLMEEARSGYPRINPYRHNTKNAHCQNMFQSPRWAAIENQGNARAMNPQRFASNLPQGHSLLGQLNSKLQKSSGSRVASSPGARSLERRAQNPPLLSSM